MEEFLKNPIWQGVAGILAFIAILVAIILFILERRKKSLVYEVIANTSLLTLDEAIRGTIQILFEGNPVQKGHLLILNILNDGNVPIAASDFERPLTFSFGENARILSAEIIKTEPANLKPTMTSISKSKIRFLPILINSKESIQVKLLLARYDGVIEVDARINGVKEVKKRAIRPSRLQFLAAVLSLYLLTGILWLIGGITGSLKIITVGIIIFPVTVLLTARLIEYNKIKDTPQ